MSKVRLSGTVLGENDPSRLTRALLLSELFSQGWDIYNGNGDQRITLANIERKIVESDAFVFTPGATLEDMFKAISIFVGYQTLDPHLFGKPTVVMNTDGSWDPFFAALDHLHRLGTIQQDCRDFLHNAETVEEVIDALNRGRERGLADAGRVKIDDADVPSFDTPLPPGHAGNICVFCSASLEDPSFLADGEEFGRRLAHQRLGCVSGAGRSGIMGAVVRGTVEAGGWAGGSNVPHIIELEGLPDGLSSFWLKPDIYTRMEVMIENSDGFVIFPGGAGTLQELFALMIFKHQQNPLMNGKPVVLFNRPNDLGHGFWDPLIGLLEAKCRSGDFTVTTKLDELIPAVLPKLPKSA